MNRTSALSYPDFARFLVHNLDEPTEGLILDALRQRGASDREIQISMDGVRDNFTNPSIDIDSPDSGLLVPGPIQEEGSTLNDLIERPDPPGGGMGVDGIDLAPPGAIDTPGEGAMVESFPVEDLAPGDVDELAQDFQIMNPEATPEEMEEYLTTIIGVPSGRANSVRVTKFASVPLRDAVNFLLERKPDIDTDSLRVRLEEFGIAPREVEEVVNSLPADQGNPRDWYTEADQMENSGAPQEDIMAFLEGEGASPEDQSSVRNSLSRGDRVGSTKVARVFDSELFGDHYELDNGDIVTYNEAVRRISASSEDETDDRSPAEVALDEFDAEEWDETSVDDTKDRLASANEVLRKVESALSVHATEKLASRYEKVKLEREILANRLDLSRVPDDDYTDSLPKFSVEGSDKTSSFGFQATGSLHEAVFEGEDAIASIDWKNEVTAGADVFVDEIGGDLIGDSGEVRKLASRYIRSLTSHLDHDDSEPLQKEFLANVEKARRTVAKNVVSKKKASVEDDFDGFDEGVFI